MRIQYSQYQQSIEKAQWLGYQRVEDEKAFGGAYYIKKGKKWIFNLKALGTRLGATCHHDFIRNGYAVEDYLIYNHLSVEDTIIAHYGYESAEYARYQESLNNSDSDSDSDYDSDYDSDSDSMEEPSDEETFDGWGSFLDFIENNCGGYLGDGMRVVNGRIIDGRA